MRAYVLWIAEEKIHKDYDWLLGWFEQLGRRQSHGLQDEQYPSTGFSSMRWIVFAEPGAPEMDFIFTICDSAAGEACPVWIGHAKRKDHTPVAGS